MSVKTRKKTYKKIALALSMCLILLLSILGTGASLAWFNDTSNEIKNIFHFAEFGLEVSHQLEDGTYEKIDGKTDLFDDEALYEPGYVQIVYLKIENKGTVPVEFKTSVTVTDYITSSNVFGQLFNLQDYLKFGIVAADSEQTLKEKVAVRDSANEIAITKLNNYSTDIAEIEAGKNVYMALIVRMPEEVGNEANYHGTTVPKVQLGVIVSATQKTN